MIVVDTNVIAYLLINGAYTHAAKIALLKDSEWISMALWKNEFKNVLSLYLKKGEMTLSQTKMLLKEAELLMQGGEYTVPSNEVLNLVNQSNCSAYDCEYVVLAQELNVPLVTTDKKILRAFPSDTISLDKYGSNY